MVAKIAAGQSAVTTLQGHLLHQELSECLQNHLRPVKLALLFKQRSWTFLLILPS